METAGEECMFRDGWAQRWQAFSNRANFRPHMSVNLSKPVHSVSPLASIKPSLSLCVHVCVKAYIGSISLFAHTGYRANNQQQWGKSFARIPDLMRCVEISFCLPILIVSIFCAARQVQKFTHSHS